MERMRESRLRRFFRRMAPQNGLTRRWLRNAFFLIVMFLLALQILFTAMLRYYYYQGVESALESRAQLYHRTTELNWGPGVLAYDTGAREVVAAFNDKDKIELQVVNTDGEVLLSSSGFIPEVERAPDYGRAHGSDDGVGTWRGRSATGERVMALTMLETDADGTVVGGLRYVVSLTAVDRQILLLSLLLFGFMLVIVFFVSLSGLYFINSIVTPVAAVNATARRIAMGEYDARLEKRYNDEIGELCDTVNFMAGEIAAAEKLKNEFISSVSHELRTPLTAIQGWTETLQNETEDKELTAQGLAVIGKEAQRLTGLVEELLDFSRMESGHVVLHWERVDLLAELEEAVFLLRDKAERSGIALELVRRRHLPIIRGDSARLKQVFVNLLDNAVKYSREGDRVRVEAARVRGGVQVVVSDTGIGISAEHLSRVTEKFYQVHATPGAGIGLALAADILRLHGGRLEIDSELNVGTTVTVWLPLES